MNVSVILSGGSGTRFGGEFPKQYCKLLGKEVVAYVVLAMKASVLTDRIVAVAQEGDVTRLKETYDIDCAEAGATHNESVKKGLAYVESRYPDCEKVLFHDAARPFLTAGFVDAYYGFLDDGFDAVITARRITDSLGRDEETFVDRTPYYLIQKPEAFRFDVLCENFSEVSPATAIVQQMPRACRVKRCFDGGQNMKITYREDLILAERLMLLRSEEKEA